MKDTNHMTNETYGHTFEHQ